MNHKEATQLLLTAILLEGLLYMAYWEISSKISSSSQTSSNHTNKSEETTAHFCKYNSNATNFERCLCYYDVIDSQNDTENLVLSPNSKDLIPINSISKCAMTIRPEGRMGNLMGEYATLLGLSHINKRPAFISPEMALGLKKYFKITMPVMSDKLSSKIRWTEIKLNNWMEESYKEFKDPFILLTFFPYSFNFYDHLREKMKKEFTLHSEIRDKAQSLLRDIKKTKKSVTFVGVHVRRGDYIYYIEDEYRGVMPTKEFFVNATAYFRNRYSDAVFVIVSNDMGWSKKNIPNDNGDVFFVGNSNETDPINDFAILVNCNHTILTIGTYGYWAGYLAGGDVVYFANFTLPDSRFLKIWKPEATFLPSWIPISADLSPLYKKYPEFG
ncbi:fucosyltransferase 1 (galactoside 2-alpha-L-fucosyltransferase, H blood group) [Chamberlinius hualienensis]